ncbi:MAG TPA: hypothetical protein VEY14_01065, partial [Nocardioidaceae bacterium]|nr:hypothetical protein [Nocardioidaceae bacterium]
MSRVTALVANSRRAWVTLALGIAAVAAVFFLPGASPVDPVSSSGLPTSFESVRAERLQSQLPTTGFEPAFAVISRDDGAALTRQDVAAAVRPVNSEGGSALPPPDISPDGTV